ncbi:MAG TPA: SDR family oxidoreductase [Solirubrobacteraceae bacterium]|nr:SDR family oxidoreductase [Solirubrobacteraceae bacterium]
MRPPVFLTGATGFLGMEVLARLLEQGDREVIALVRARDDVAAQERIDGVLAQLWRDPARHRDRVRAVAGDVTSDGLGMSSAVRTALAEDVGAILHCAASISFDMPLDEARAINVEGTREVIGFARECKALGRLDRFVHVSTAYVAGKYEGTFRERQLDAGQEFRNTYEQTKWEAEHIVRAATDLAPAIARPSIVMGESDSGWTPAFNVLYWPLRAFSRGLFDEIPSLPSAHVDIVPVDYVADGLVRLLDVSDQGVFNLVAGRDAPFANEVVELACDRFDRPRPEVVHGGGPDDDEHGAVYMPYFDMEIVFDDSRARAALGGLRPPPLNEFFGTLMDYAEETRWGKRSMTREEARERFSREPAAA